MTRIACTEFAPFDAMTFFALVLLGTMAIYLGWIRQTPAFLGKRFFAVTVAALIWWLAMVILELWLLDPACKALAGRLAYPGIAVIPPAWALFIYCYALGRTDKLGPWRIAIVFGGSAVISAAVLTNPMHELFYGPGTRPVSDLPGARLQYEYGPLFLASASWLYMWLVAGVAMLVAGAFRTQEVYRPHFLILFILTLVPMTANVAHLFLGFTVSDFDPTPLFFAAALLVYSWVISSEQIFDLGARARHVIFRQLQNPVLILDAEGRLSGANPPARAAFGLEHGELPAPVKELEERLRAGEIPRGQARLMALAGRSWEVQCTPIQQPVPGAGGPMGWVLMFVDFTEMVQRQQVLQSRLEALFDRYNEAERAARQDSLTGLLNRRSLADAFPAALDAAEGGPLALALIDLDRFKQVNDTFGHATGDRVLSAFARALEGGFRVQDLVFRAGGEEFVILSPGLAAEQLGQRLRSLLSALENEIILTDAPDYRISFSAGVVVVPGEAASLEEALSRADGRLYAAKNSGRSRVLANDGWQRVATTKRAC